jgi:DNA-binding response OmpR family regulator
VPPDNELRTGSFSELAVALIVEDNIMIALEVEAFLEDLGVTNCFIASTVESALAILDLRDITFGVVDVDLGGVTSDDVAEALSARNLPFLFATGYGEALPIMAGYPNVPVLMKPFTPKAMATALGAIGVL